VSEGGLSEWCAYRSLPLQSMPGPARIQPQQRSPRRLGCGHSSLPTRCSPHFLDSLRGRSRRRVFGPSGMPTAVAARPVWTRAPRGLDADSPRGRVQGVCASTHVHRRPCPSTSASHRAVGVSTGVHSASTDVRARVRLPPRHPTPGDDSREHRSGGWTCGDASGRRDLNPRPLDPQGSQTVQHRSPTCASTLLSEVCRSLAFTRVRRRPSSIGSRIGSRRGAPQNTMSLTQRDATLAEEARPHGRHR
jgi:hypothetical protein